MTTDPIDQPVPASPADPAGFQEGIYLENKKGSIGTGSTAKSAEYKNFWATASLKDDSAVMALLDSEFKPTAVLETFSLEVLTGPNWFFVTEGQKKYQQLRPILDRLLAAQAQKTAEAEAAKAKAAEAKAKAAEPAAANWWGGAAPSGPPANPFELKKTDKKQPAAKKGSWWEK
jgi:hypothetical protein